MKLLLKLRFVIAIIILIMFFQNFFTGRYSLASNTRDGETIFKNVCASCHMRGGIVVTKGSKSLKFNVLIVELLQNGGEHVESTLCCFLTQNLSKWYRKRLGVHSS